MKTLKIFLVPVFMFFIGIYSFGQTQSHPKVMSVKADTIIVSGNCDLCKARIEKAAMIDGVNKATWDKETKKLVVVYNPSKANIDEVQKKIAAVGHDTPKFKADDKVYNSLPGCCKYRKK